MLSQSQPSYTNNDASDRSMRTATNDDMSIILMTQIGNDQICEDKDENQSDSSSEDSSSSGDEDDNAKPVHSQEDLKVNDKDDYEEEKKDIEQWKGEEQWKGSLMNQTVFDGIIDKRDRQDSLSSGDAEFDYKNDRMANLFNSAEVESYDKVGKKFNYTGCK